jgi:hypothetical protein
MKGRLIGRIRNTKDFAEERITLRLRLRFILSSAKIQKKVLFLQMKTKYTLLGILPMLISVDKMYFKICFELVRFGYLMLQ